MIGNLKRETQLFINNITKNSQTRFLISNSKMIQGRNKIIKGELMLRIKIKNQQCHCK